MVCNGKNHRWNCDCRFGGSGGHAANASVTPTTRDLFAGPGTVRLHTTPNARCPVCSDAVFFYELINGGRVYFDELGPPWPKHPCTDPGSAFNQASGDGSQSQSRASEDSLWVLLTEVFVEQASKGVLRLSGKLGDKSLLLHVRSDAFGDVSDPATYLSQSFIQTRPATERYSLALLTPDARPMLIAGYESISDLENT